MRLSTFGRKVHRFVGISALFFIVLLAVTGILLNHAETIDAWQRPADAFGYPQQTRSITANNAYVWAAAHNGVFRSGDNGQTWEKIDLKYPLEDIFYIHVQKGIPDRLWIASRSGIVMVQNLQNTVWERVMLPEGIAYVEGFTVDGAALHVKTRERLYSSADTGESWAVRYLPGRKGPSLRERVLDWHTGMAFGPFWKYINDAAAIGVILLSFTGLYLYLRPYIRKWLL